MTTSRERTGLSPDKTPDWFPESLRLAPGEQVAKITTTSSGVVEKIGDLTVTRTAVSRAVLDAIGDLSGFAGLQRQSAVINSLDVGVSLIGRTKIYVSNEASNGFVIGNDSNSGLSKAAPKLTIAAAHTLASAGDVIIVNGPLFDSTFYSIDKPVTIMPYLFRGTTIRSTNVSYTMFINSDNVTLGALIIDCTITAGGLSGSAVRTPAAVSYKKGTRLIGTKLRANTYSVYHTGTITMQGVEVESIGTAKAWARIEPAAAGAVLIEDLIHDGYMTCKPSVDGVSCVVRRSSVKSSYASKQRALEIVGCRSVLVEDNEFGVDVSTGATGVNVTAHSTYDTDVVTIRRNRVANGVSAAQNVAGENTGYGIGVGGEDLSPRGKINALYIYGNDISHVNHGLFIGAGVSWARAWGNVVRDSVIGLIAKLCGPDVVIHSNIVIGGPLSGGAVRTKGSTGSKLTNNLVIWDASSVAAGAFIQADEATEGPSVGVDIANNVLYAPSSAVAKAVVIGTGSSAKLRANDYFAGSFGTGAFAGLDTLAAWAAANEPTALGVDPKFVGGGDWRLSASSPLGSAGIAGLADCDFMGRSFADAVVGPMPVAA